MKKNTLFLIVIFFLINIANGQENKQIYTEKYLIITLDSKAEVQQLGKNFVIDRVDYQHSNNTYDVRIWVNKNDYTKFKALQIPYKEYIEDNNSKSFQMATTLTQMWTWDYYPTYPLYQEYLSHYQTTSPTQCNVDTVLESTVNGRSIYAVQVAQNIDQVEDKPQVLLSSTMHGDETAPYFMMLRLIDYLLANQEDEKVAEILNNVDLWICPNTNPDGTYRNNDNLLGNNSTRSNGNNVDLNRSFPTPTDGTLYNSSELEVVSMMEFAYEHNFVMGANYHGGSELVNYPWDTWVSNDLRHPDHDWLEQISIDYATSCHERSPSGYFTGMNDGVTHGGDWYITDGSRQDYMLYFHHCREFTMEISNTKALSSEYIDAYWMYNKEAILDFILAATKGFSGRIVDANTNEPIKAKVFVENHDTDQSFVYANAAGYYFRPIEAGNYQVTFSANGYQSQTVTINVEDEATTDTPISLYPESTIDIIVEQNNTNGTYLIFSPTEEGNLYWYENISDSAPFYIGDTLTLPQNTDYINIYVSSPHSDTLYGGDDRIESAGGYFTNTNAHAQIFDCDNKVKLLSVKVNAKTSGERTILLLNKYRNTVQDTTIYIEQGIQEVLLNFNIPQANAQLLSVLEGEACGFWRNNQIGDYHYTIGPLSITQNTAFDPTYYYYFYDWKIVVPATKSKITIAPSAISSYNQNNIKIYPNPTNSVINIDYINKEDVKKIELVDMNGKVLRSFTKFTPQILLEGMVSGTYFLRITSENQYIIKKVIKL